MVAIFRTLRTHWKKSIFAAGLVACGATWANRRHDANLVRRAVCQEAAEYGRQTLGASERPKRVTVFLNAAAGKGKAKNLFEQNAEPVLHLAGFEVTVVKTDREGQAKELLGALDNVDMIVVAGGDGTLLEVVTGMLRRDDQASFSKIPIGIIPLGKSNTLSKIIFPDFEDHVRCITSAALAIVKGSTIPVDVIQITGTFGKPVFALNELRWGEFRNAKANTSRFWYFGPMRMFASFIGSTFKPWPPTHNATLRFTPAVQRPPLPPEGGTPPPTRPPFLFRLIARIRGLWPTHATEDTDIKEVEWDELNISSMEVAVRTLNHQLDATKPEAMEVTLMPGSFSKLDFLKAAFSKHNLPDMIEGRCKTLQVQECVLHPESLDSPFDIDHEEYDAMPITVRVLPWKLRFFCSSTARKQLLQEVQPSS